MRQRNTSQTPPEDPRAIAVKRILNIAELVRQRGNPDEASEAIQWEKQLRNRLKEIEANPNPQHAQAA